MRGENLALLEIVPTVAETSPHAWRKRTDTVVRTAEGGNISTCVEKTYNVEIEEVGDGETSPRA